MADLSCPLDTDVICVGMDPNTDFTAVCTKKGNKIIKWGNVAWTPEDYTKMSEALKEFIPKGTELTLVEQQMNQPMVFRSGVLIGMAASLGSRKSSIVNGYQYKSHFGLVTGHRDSNKTLVVNLTAHQREDYFGKDAKQTKETINGMRKHDLGDASFICDYAFVKLKQK